MNHQYSYFASYLLHHIYFFERNYEHLFNQFRKKKIYKIYYKEINCLK